MTLDQDLRNVWLTAAQLREISIELDTNVVTIARAFNCDERTARRWISGEQLIPGPVSVLIRLLLGLKRKLDYRQMADQLRAEAALLDTLALAKEKKMMPRQKEALAAITADEAKKKVAA